MKKAKSSLNMIHFSRL